MSNEVFLSLIPRGPANNTFLCSTQTGPQWVPAGGSGSNPVINGDVNITVNEVLPNTFDVSLNSVVQLVQGADTMNLEATSLRFTNTAPDEPIIELNQSGLYVPSVNIINNASTTLYMLPTGQPTVGQIIKSAGGTSTVWADETSGSVTGTTNVVVTPTANNYSVALAPQLNVEQVSCADQSGSTTVNASGITIDDSDFAVVSELNTNGLTVPAVTVSSTSGILYSLPSTAGSAGQYLSKGAGNSTVWATATAQGSISGTTDQITVTNVGDSSTISLNDDIVLPAGSSITVDTISCNNSFNTMLIDASGIVLSRDSDNAIVSEINTTGLYSIGIHQLSPITNAPVYRLPTGSATSGQVITADGSGATFWAPAVTGVSSSSSNVILTGTPTAPIIGFSGTPNFDGINILDENGIVMYAMAPGSAPPDGSIITYVGGRPEFTTNTGVPNPLVLQTGTATSSLSGNGLEISNDGTPIASLSLGGLQTQFVQVNTAGGPYSLPSTTGASGSTITLLSDGTSVWTPAGQASTTTAVYTNDGAITASVTVQTAAINPATDVGSVTVSSPGLFSVDNRVSSETRFTSFVGNVSDVPTLGHQIEGGFFTGFRASNLVIDDTTIVLTDYKYQTQMTTQGSIPLNVYTPNSTNDGLTNEQPLICEIRVSRDAVSIDLNPGNVLGTIIGLDVDGTLTDNSTYLRAVTTQSVPMNLWPRNHQNKNTVLFSCTMAHDMLMSSSAAQVANLDFSQSTDFVGIDPSVTFIFYRVSPIDPAFEVFVYVNVAKTAVGRPGILQLYAGIPQPVNYFAGVYQNMLVGPDGTPTTPYENNPTTTFQYNTIFNPSIKYIRFVPPQLSLYDPLNNDFMYSLPCFAQATL